MEAPTTLLDKRCCCPFHPCRVILPPQIKPEVDKSFKVPTEPGSVLGIGTDVPPPLVPFAGCDRKAMPPSPAKPFSLPASPYKPSPFKEVRSRRNHCPVLYVAGKQREWQLLLQQRQPAISTPCSCNLCVLLGVLRSFISWWPAKPKRNGFLHASAA